jgi:hypothetical protein
MENTGPGQAPVIDLLSAVLGCRYIEEHFDRGSSECSPVIQEQGTADRFKFQVPEASSGAISTAPILFIGSNPSIDVDEDFPTYNWSDAKIQDFFEHRFDSANEWVRDGVRVRCKSGGFGKRVKTWGQIMANVQRRHFPIHEQRWDGLARDEPGRPGCQRRRWRLRVRRRLNHPTPTRRLSTLE